MRPKRLFFALLVLLPAVPASSAEMSIEANFTVLAPNQLVADSVAKQAEAFRKQSALEWLGKELPSGMGQSVITVDISAEKDEGLTWPIDRRERTLHQVWLTTSTERALSSTLHHEVIHTVLDSHFYPESPPAWASEGIASQADDDARKQYQRLILARWSQSGRWPALRSLFDASRIDHDDLSRYAAASSVTEFLVARGGKPRVVEFVTSGLRSGWDQAVSEYYGMHDIAELQSAWQSWVTQKLSKAGTLICR